MVRYFRQQSDLAFAELQLALKDVDERMSWARLTAKENDYLHTDGSILGQVTHVAGCKVLYASAAFRGFEIRLKEITERTIAIGSDWRAALDYLDESQEYWVSSWKDLPGDSLQSLAATNWGEQWPIWKIIHTVTAHDSYHAGQVALTRTVEAAANTPPPPMSDEEIGFLKTFSAW
jgi:hypothetical protein